MLISNLFLIILIRQKKKIHILCMDVCRGDAVIVERRYFNSIKIIVLFRQHGGNHYFYLRQKIVMFQLS